ncbi:YihY/virulence factor BrkB family protein [Streptomyces sp. ODS28]|uniref:YihY/virulence factor BrkB family protein n=1 Tax=Streptomyces sp. ODS28 TaxID=3136688 RepID=UPI0031EF43C4
MSGEHATRDSGARHAEEGQEGGSVRTRGRLRIGEMGRALCRVPASIWNDDVTDWAAALTYYAVLALFPTLLVTLSLVGIAGPATTAQLIHAITTVLPETSRDPLGGALRAMAGQRTDAWLLAVLGTIWALWSSSSYLAVFRRALHSMHRVPDTRPVRRKIPRIVLTATTLLLLLMGSVCVLMISGELARAVGHMAGMDAVAARMWQTLRWPVLLLLVSVLVLVVFRTGPPVGGLRHRLPGGVLAVVLWLITCGGFAFYAAHVGTYHRLYGSLAGVVVFLVWLWLSNLALLAGAQFNAELHHRRTARSGF